MPNPPAFFVLFVITAILAEIAWARWRGRRIHDLRESLCSLSMVVVNRLLRPLSLAWGMVVMFWFEQVQVLRLPETAWAWLLTFLITDFAYYWYHRLGHALPLLWSMHYTHHSSRWMNLTTAMRLNWIATFIGPLFFAPLVLIGLSPSQVIAALALNLAWQFFLHTETIGSLGWLEGRLINTPSAHRVHHGRNAAYINKNFGGVLIVWDRLFGTYAAEQEPVRYGAGSGRTSYNPLVIQFLPLWQYLCEEWRRLTQATVAERLKPRGDGGA